MALYTEDTRAHTAKIERPAEIPLRVAVKRPELVRALLITATAGDPLPHAGWVAMMDWAAQRQAKDGPDAAAAMVLGAFTSNPALDEGAEATPAYRRAVAHMSQMLGAMMDSLGGDTQMLQTYWKNWATQYWRHWGSVRQPLRLLAGLDDATTMVAMENLVSIMPNASIEYEAGVAHVPELEAPEWFRNQLLGWVEGAVSGVDPTHGCMPRSPRLRVMPSPHVPE